MDAIKFNVENITNKEEIAILTRLAILNELSNKLVLISRILGDCGQSVDVSMLNFNPRLNKIVSEKVKEITMEIAKIIDKYASSRKIEDLLALVQALLAGTSTTLEICSVTIKEFVKEKLLELGGVEDER